MNGNLQGGLGAGQWYVEVEAKHRDMLQLWVSEIAEDIFIRDGKYV